MLDPDQVTPIILTFNEAPNLGRTLAALNWAKQILIVDSFSTDATLRIAAGFPQVRVLQRGFDCFAAQCNFGLGHIHTPWVLSLDADYVLSEALVREILELDPNERVAGYQARFRYWICGRPLRRSLYPPRTVLYRREGAFYLSEGHAHRVNVDGPVARLTGWIEHDDRKPIGRWFEAQWKYADAESRLLRETPGGRLNWRDRIRRDTPVAPVLVALHTLLGRGVILDGARGWYYVLQRAVAESLLSLCILEDRLWGQRKGEK
jgi:glycosyltransferase involved in cell wall biosynthesis